MHKLRDFGALPSSMLATFFFNLPGVSQSLIYLTKLIHCW
jgi:hypothetical protein